MSDQAIEKTASSSNFKILLLTYFTIVLTVIIIKMLYKEPHQRPADLCMPVYQTYNWVYVDLFSIVFYDDSSSRIKHAQATSRFYNNCVTTVSKWKWLKSF